MTNSEIEQLEFIIKQGHCVGVPCSCCVIEKYKLCKVEHSSSKVAKQLLDEHVIDKILLNQ